MKLNRQGVLLTAVMLTGLTATIAGVIRRFAPAWQPGYLVAACFLVALESGLVHYVMRVERMWLAELARYLVPEIMAMVALMRVASTLSLGAATLGEDARRWLYDPLSFFDAVFLGFIVAGLLVGGLAHAGMRDLSELAPQPFEAPETPELLASGSKGYQVIVAQDRAVALRRINSRFVVGGVILLCALGLEAVNIQRIAGPSLPISRLSAGGALLYLICGFLLYSQARLALLQARWRLDGSNVAESVGRRWTRASWLLIVGIAGVALALPRSYGLGLLDTLRGAFSLLGYAIALLGYLVLWLFSLLAFIPVWLLSLFASPDRTTPPPQPLVPPPAPDLPEFAHQPRLLSAVIFWVCMIALASYAIWIVLQRHPGLRLALLRLGPLAWLLRRLSWLWRDTRAWAGHAAQSVQSLLRRPLGTAASRRMPALRLSRLAPRELVRYFYRSTLQRAATRGLRRRTGQTPYEYGTALAERLPDVQQEIAELTEAFVVAHYSPRLVGSDEVRRARRPWERIRRRLRALDDDRRPARDEDGRRSSDLRAASRAGDEEENP